MRQSDDGLGDMGRRTMKLVAAGTVALLAASLQGQAPADAGEAPAPGGPHVVGGWVGQDPVPVGVAVDGLGLTTAAFTTTGLQPALWTSDGTLDGDWGRASVRGTDVVPGSATFAMNEHGAAVLAWTRQWLAGTELVAATRSHSDASWSAPEVLATDPTGLEHDASVGIDDAGRSFLVYRHEVAGVPAAFTRRHEEGEWTAPHRRSGPGDVTQVRMEVSRLGYALAAWDEFDPEYAQESDPQSPYVMSWSQWLPDQGRWRDPSRGGWAQAEVGVQDLATNDGDLFAYATSYFRYGDRGPWITRMSHTRHRESTEDLCLGCPEDWRHLPLGDPDYDPQPAETQLAKLGRPDDEVAVLSLSDAGGGDVGLDLYVSALDFFSEEAFARLESGGNPHSLRMGDDRNRLIASYLYPVPGGDEARVVVLDAHLGGLLFDTGTVRLGPTSAAAEVAMGRSGESMVLWTDSSDGQPVVRSRSFTDEGLTGSLRTFHHDRRPLVRWEHATTDDTYDVSVRRAQTSGRLGAAQLWREDTTATGARVDLRAGETFCTTARRRRGDDTVSRWSAQRCITAPLDDTVLRRHGPWTVQRNRYYWQRTLVATKRQGATLVLPDAAGRSLALLADRTPGGGKVRVTWAGEDLGVFSLRGHIGHRVRVPVGRSEVWRRGPVTIQVVSSGARVGIDGLHVGPV